MEELAGQGLDKNRKKVKKKDHCEQLCVREGCKIVGKTGVCGSCMSGPYCSEVCHQSLCSLHQGLCKLILDMVPRT